MPVGQQTQQEERVFGLTGETEEVLIPPAAEDPVEEPIAEEPAAEEPEAETPAAAAAAHKYRIGDKTFATQAEALAYAEQTVTQTSEADAMRQVLRETISQIPRTQTVTPQEIPQENHEEIYTNPGEYLRKRDERIKAEVLQQIQTQQASADADARVWREFTDRHPDLADFRTEITMLVQQIQPEVQSTGRRLGPNAAYDYVATKFKAQVERAAAVLKPKRELKQSTAGTPAGDKGEKVMPKTRGEKPLSFAQQLRSIRKGR